MLRQQIAPHFTNIEKGMLSLKFSSLAELEIVKMTTSDTASDGTFVKMTTFCFSEGTGRWNLRIPTIHYRHGISGSRYTLRGQTPIVCVADALTLNTQQTASFPHARASTWQACHCCSIIHDHCIPRSDDMVCILTIIWFQCVYISETISHH